MAPRRSLNPNSVPWDKPRRACCDSIKTFGKTGTREMLNSSGFGFCTSGFGFRVSGSGGVEVWFRVERIEVWF